MALVSDARSKTVSAVIGCGPGCLVRRPYAARKTTAPPWTTAMTAPGTSPRATAPFAAAAISSAVAAGRDGAAFVSAGGAAAARVMAVAAGGAGTAGTARVQPVAARAARAREWTRMAGGEDSVPRRGAAVCRLPDDRI